MLHLVRTFFKISIVLVGPVLGRFLIFFYFDIFFCPFKDVYIKTLKPCKLIVTLRNSNDRPTVPANQIRSIDEQSAQDLLVQTPIDADDEDEGQGLIFTLVRTERGDDNRNAKDTPNKNELVDGASQPFVVGQCSGIIKVKDDVLRYDFDQVLDDASIRSGIRQYKLYIHVEDKDDDDQEFSTGRSCFI